MACRYNVSANASSIPNYIIPRTAIPNPKVTAYLNGTLVWGSEPSLVGSCTAAFKLYCMQSIDAMKLSTVVKVTIVTVYELLWCLSSLQLVDWPGICIKYC